MVVACFVLIFMAQIQAPFANSLSDENTFMNSANQITANLYESPDSIFVLDDGECYTTGPDLYCRGSNTYNRLGLGSGAPSTVNNWTKVPIDSEYAVVEMDQYLYQTCALLSDGSAWCWGANYYGQVGGTESAVDTPRKINHTGVFSAISTGTFTSCGIDSGDVYCWGTDYYKLITDTGNSTKYTTPQLLPQFSQGNATDIANTYYFTCVTDDFDDIYCRGLYFGLTGAQNWTKLNLTNSNPNDIDLEFLDGEFGYYDVCLNSSAMNLWCVGFGSATWKNSTGAGVSFVEHNLSNVDSFTTSTSDQRICASLTNDSIYCRGSTSQIKSGSTSSTEFTFFDQPEFKASEIKTGKSRLCTTSIRETLGCYDDGDHLLELEIADALEADIINGVVILENSSLNMQLKEIVSTNIDTNRTNFSNLNLQLALYATENQSVELTLEFNNGTQITAALDLNVTPTFSGAEAIVRRASNSMSFGDKSSCEIEKITARLFCSAEHTGLNIPTYPNEESQRPLDGIGQHRQVLANRTFVDVATDTARGGYCAVASDGEVLCKAEFSLGYDSLTPVDDELYSPFPNSNATSIVMSGNQKGNYCAVLTNGSVACKGKSTPFEGTSRWATNFVDSSNGNITKISIVDHACHLTDQGDVECWGNNNLGRLGIGQSSTYSSSSPVKVSNPSGVSSPTYNDVQVAEYHSCASTTNSNLYCWGRNVNGELGLGNSQQSYNTPQTVVSNGSVKSFAVSEANTCYMNYEGDIYCWGDGYFWGVSSDKLSPSFEKSVGKLGAEICDLERVASDEWMIGLNCGGIYRFIGHLGADHGLHTSNDYSGILPSPKEQVEGEFVLSAILDLTEGEELIYESERIEVKISNNQVFNINLNDSGVQKNLTWTTNSTQELVIFINGLEFSLDFDFEIVPDTDFDIIPNLYDTDDDNDAIPDTLDSCPIQVGNSTVDRRGCPDTDGDGTSNVGDPFPNDKTQWSDQDGDGFGDNSTGLRPDECPTTYGDSKKNNTYGCVDSDGDGWADIDDTFDSDSSQWSDSDGDGYGDEFSGFQGDACKNIAGNSTTDRFGCADSDGDGYSDLGDAFDNNPTQYLDSDGDGYGNNQSANATQSDAFPSDGTQWNDTDGDGHGDNKYGTQGDHFPNNPNRWQDSDEDGYANEDDAFDNDPTQWNDTDGDGYGDNQNGSNADLFPNDSSEWYDSDGDGVGDNSDDFKFDGSQSVDADNDGYGDNPNGTNGDQFANDSLRWSDRDGDGYSDQQNDDAFINDPSQWNDSDGDGYGDNANGNNPDAFVNDSSEWKDTDGDGVGNNGDWAPTDGTQWADADNDGFGDNPNGTNGDKFTNDSLRWSDTDGDGYSNQQGDDAFINDPTQWNDTDGDGYGDNQNGTNADLFPNNSSEWYDADGDGVGDNSDDFIYDGSQTVDSDGDGYGDNANGSRADLFPNDPNEWYDNDGDGVGNNGDAFPTDGTQWVDADNDGYGDNPNGFNGDQFLNDSLRWSDRDGDNYSDQENDDAFPLDPSQWADQDGDGYGDNPNGTRPDAFPTDNTEWSDIDGDGYGDNSDVFRFDGSQWADRDGDGYGDNPNGTNADAFPDDSTRWSDSDKDGIADEDDDFANDPTQSVDSDNDGYGDDANGTNPDAFPNDPTEWRDGDGDGYGDNSDAFPVDATQWADTDGDGYGDNKYGSQGDHFPNDATRWKDSDEDGVADEDDAFINDPTQSEDRDGDGYGDNESGTNPDQFPDDGTEWEDSDNDGVGDNADAFVFDPTQSSDSDADGYGDNQTGSNGDAFPNNPLRWADTDKDGYADQDDAFPNDNTQWNDTDGDGYGDNANGTNPDAFPNDPTQHADRDGDGYGDNPLGMNADAFPSDTTQWSDQDGDGYGDNPTGQQPDQFPENPTQYIDEDGDGLGDNQSGTEADPSLNDADNDGYTDDVDILPNLASPGDLDNDGVLDEDDAFPADFREFKDSDDDGEGDNADVDDDNDGWTDIDEIRQGSDPFSSSVQPVEGFELIIPGTQVSLGAWDIIGIFTGVPLAAWIGLGLMTRTSRGRRFESALDEAKSLEELNQIAAEYETALMWKMLGPHQGLRLERMRTEIERDKFAEQLKSLPKIKTDAEPLMTATAGSTHAPAEASGPPDASVEAQKTDENGYE